MRIEFLTADHCKKFDGNMPQYNLKGLAITDGEEVLAVCCMSLINGANFIICGIAEGAGKRHMIKGWSIFSQMLREDVTYYALIDRDIPSAPGFLKHFGFEPFKDDIYVYKGV